MRKQNENDIRIEEPICYNYSKKKNIQSND